MPSITAVPQHMFTQNNEPFITVINPATQNEITKLRISSKKDISDSIIKAEHAFHVWKETSLEERAKKLIAWAERIDKNSDTLAKTITQESGKPLAEAHAEVLYAKSFVTWFASQIDEIKTHRISLSDELDCHISWRPVGPVYAITPWNFPAAMVTRKIAPAFAAGCSVILKPSELTPLSAILLQQLAIEAGIPANLFQILLGDAAHITSPMMNSMSIRKVTFTGSTHVGKLLFAQAAHTIKRLSLELGGNAPFIVFESANLDTAIDALLAAKLRNAGQTCVSPNRIFVADTIEKNFIEKLCTKINNLKIGNGLDKDIHIGPLINQKAIDKIESHVKNALENGAICHLGGKKHPAGPLFYYPTILSNMNDDMLAFQEETFGPLISITSFHTREEAIQRANQTEFGLAAYIAAESQEDIDFATNQLESGMIGVNNGRISSEKTPFGGIKQSGLGREGAKEGMFEFLETHTATYKI